jgi:uncharacterized protein (DUF2345 family)
MSLFADQDVSVSSVNGTVRISAKKELVLESGGAFIQIKDGSITLGGPLDLFIKTITIQKQGKASMQAAMPTLPKFIEHLFDRPVWVVDERGYSIPNRPIRVHLKNGEILNGKTDQDGITQLAISDEADVLKIEVLKKLSGKNV